MVDNSLAGAALPLLLDAAIKGTVVLLVGFVLAGMLRARFRGKPAFGVGTDLRWFASGAFGCHRRAAVAFAVGGDGVCGVAPIQRCHIGKGVGAICLGRTSKSFS